MPNPSAQSASDPATDAFFRLRAHVIQVQNEAIDLEGLIEGLSILREHADGSNAFGVVLSLALEKASAIMEALDSVNLPKLESVPA